MAISRYYQPIQQQYVSQFIPEDMRLYKQLLDQKQSQYDKNALAMQTYEDALLNEKALEGYDTEQLQNIRKEYEDFSTSMVGKDLADPNNYREIASFIRKSKYDDRLKNIRAGVATKAKYDELKDKYSQKEFQYAVENDPMLKAYQQYIKQGDKFAINYIQGKESFPVGVDMYSNKEKYFKNIGTAGREVIESLSAGDLQRFYKEGWSGKTTQKIKKVAGSEFDDYVRSPGGQQMLRWIDTYRPDLKTNEEIKNYMLKDFIETGMKQQGVKYTTNKDVALNQLAAKTEEKKEQERKARISAGNTTVGAMGVTGTKVVEPAQRSWWDYFTSGASFLGEFGKEILKGIDNPSEAFSGGFENWVAKTAKETTGKTATPEQINRIKTAFINFKHSLSPEDAKAWGSMSNEKKGEKFNTWLEQMASMSIEEFAEIPLDPATKSELNDIVKFNQNLNVPVTIKSVSDQDGYDDDLKMSGLSDQPTMQELTSKGFKAVQGFVYASGASHPGQRLGIVMEDDEGNAVTVATKGSLVLGTDVNRFIPSEVSTYTPDLLTQAKYNYENATYKIPLNPNEYHQMTDKTQINSPDYEPVGDNITTNIDGAGYSVSVNLPSLGRTQQVYISSRNNDSYKDYVDVLEDLSEYYNDPTLSQKAKTNKVIEYIKSYNQAQLVKQEKDGQYTTDPNI